MAKEKKDKNQKFEDAYIKITGLLGIDKKTKAEQSKALIEAGSNLMTDICKHADSIKIDDHSEIENIIGISPGDYQKIVGLGYRTKYKKLSEKAIDKIVSGANADVFMAKIKNHYQEMDENGKPELVFNVSEDADTIIPENLSSDEEFEEVFNRSVETRAYLNESLWAQFKEYQMAWVYLWEFKYKNSDYKMLVDFLHYIDGGYPKEDSKPKHVSAAISIWRTLSLMLDFKEDYGFFWDVLSNELGITAKQNLSREKAMEYIDSFKGGSLDEK